ncbi:MAG: hypothetical protein JRC60_08620, partial [Deltaproteobacteria bacterium]|nr:hypothetical protein [Deltaproteobacteria bacterium]
MQLHKLNLTPREQRVLESMGITTVEQVALSTRYDLGFGKSRGDAIITRARNVLAYENIKGIDVGEDRVVVVLVNPSEAVVTSVKDVLGVLWTKLDVALEDAELSISLPKKTP